MVLEHPSGITRNTGMSLIHLPAPGQECDGWMLDGQQRLTTILDYVKDGFAGRGLHWSELTDLETRHFARISVAVVETNIADPAICRDLYDRLVYGGTPHDPNASHT
jgi:hypothetical protein